MISFYAFEHSTELTILPCIIIISFIKRDFCNNNNNKHQKKKVLQEGELNLVDNKDANHSCKLLSERKRKMKSFKASFAKNNFLKSQSKSLQSSYQNHCRAAISWFD